MKRRGKVVGNEKKGEKIKENKEAIIKKQEQVKDKEKTENIEEFGRWMKKRK